MPHALDYSALREPVTKTDIEAFKNSGLHSSFTIVNAAIAVALIIFIVLLFPYAIATFQSFGFSLASVGPVVIIFLFSMFILQILNNSTKRRAKLYKFAQRNNLTFLTNVPRPEYPGMIFTVGSSQRIDDALRFMDGTEIGNYSYETGSGKSRQTHTWAYAKIKLSRRLPHMVLDARSNNFWKFSNLSSSFDRTQTLSLEGDFDKYFTLYAPKQYERDALYVFTPDVMATMIDYGQAYDIEIVDDDLFIYGSEHFKLDQPEFYERILAIIDTIGSELINQTDYYADERIGNRTANIVAPEGERLKTGFSWLVVVVIVIVIYFNIFHPIIFRLLNGL